MPEPRVCPTHNEPLNIRGQCSTCVVRGFMAAFAPWFDEQLEAAKRGEDLGDPERDDLQRDHGPSPLERHDPTLD